MPLHGSISIGVKHFGLTGSSGPTNFPINVTATANSSGQITLTWTNPSNNFSIRVYRGGVLLTTLTKGSTSYVNTGLTANTAYTYQLSYFGSGIEKKENTTHTGTTCLTNTTFISETCTGTLRVGTYANGNCGTYNSNIGYTQGYCGYCDPSGTSYGEYCSGTERIGTYANGSCGTYDSAIGYTQGYCGYCDPYGTYYGNYCDGSHLINVYADGGCGTYTADQGEIVGQCGVTCISYGTVVNAYCSGTSTVTVYADGGCGTYSTTQNIDCSCGYCQPGESWQFYTAGNGAGAPAGSGWVSIWEANGIPECPCAGSSCNEYSYIGPSSIGIGISTTGYNDTKSFWNFCFPSGVNPNSYFYYGYAVDTGGCTCCRC